MRGELHRGCEEAILVAGDVAFQQGDDVARGSHRADLVEGLCLAYKAAIAKLPFGPGFLLCNRAEIRQVAPALGSTLNWFSRRRFSLARIYEMSPPDTRRSA